MRTSFETLDDQYKSGYMVCINQGWNHSLAPLKIANSKKLSPIMKSHLAQSNNFTEKQKPAPKIF